MRVLVIHNSYRIYGGEDAVVEAECNGLRAAGVHVDRWSVHNGDIDRWWKKLVVAVGCVFSVRRYFQLRRVIRDTRPDVVHVHNFFPQISPSVFYACKAEHTPCVLTLHNYRILCPSSTLLRNGRPYRRSLDVSPWWGVLERVYQKSALATFFLTCMISLHKRLGTWQSKVARFIVLSKSSREIFLDGGLPADRIRVKGNFVRAEPKHAVTRDGFLFVGRLSEEKGIRVLLRCLWEANGALRVRFAGDGPLRDEVLSCPYATYLGSLSPGAVRAEMNAAEAVIVPSIWAEPFGLVVLEAYATATPVIASSLGALSELVINGKTGLHVKPGGVEDLRVKLKWAMENPAALRTLGENGREFHQENHSEKVNIACLLSIYWDAITSNQTLVLR